ncbi:hypothetical protein [Thauera sp.]|uniref:hypothetical protein n=1 Tax=Thauera sp. TaxID=1905334 RepID=UPI00261A68A4|nr:hypothetical protein [Thauera sp.]
MSLLNPFAWFARASAGKTAAEDDPRFSRRAADSSDVAMDDGFSLRMPAELKTLGLRRARALGFSTMGEYARFLITVDCMDEDDVDILPSRLRDLVIQKGRGGNEAR